MRKIQFGAGGLHIEGWENYDGPDTVDITKPLPFPDRSVDVVFADMCLEHVTHREAWSFLEECFRVLAPRGLIRMTVPDFQRIWKLKDPDWLRVNRQVTGNDGSLREQMRTVIFGHGHQAIWSAQLLKAVMEAIGFDWVTVQLAGESDFEELRNIEQHHRSVGVAVASAESGCVEGVKPR